MAAPSIVIINATVSTAPAPSLLQETGAIVSQGSTTLAAGTSLLLTQDSDLTSSLTAPAAITSMSWSGGTVLVTTTSAIPGANSGDKFQVIISGVTPSGFNGTYGATVTGGNTFTYSLVANPGTVTVQGTYTVPGQSELLDQVSTFFEQGGSQAVYVLELGAADGSTGPALLTTWLANNPGQYYSFLLPHNWDGTSGLTSLLNLYTAPTAKTYFFVTTTASTYTSYSATQKCVVALVPTPGRPLTEDPLAAAFQHALNYAPSSTNRMTPFAFSYLYSVTAYPTSGNAALLTTLKANYTNYVGTGAEGGISNTILLWGKTRDGQDFAWWYSADWIQINCDLNTSNVVISQSQNPSNPLVYDQQGIDRLQDTAVATVTSAITYGLATGTVTRTSLDPITFANNLDDGVYAGQNVVNAVPFATYVAENPNDYPIGRYAGLQVVYLPQNGFQQIVFNINITNILTQ
jgi:hypothetical protein